MRDLTSGAKKRLSQRERDAAQQFDALLLHNAVYDGVSEYAPLRQVLDVAERAYAIEENQQHRDDIRSAGFDAAETLNDHIDDLVEDAVLEECVGVIKDVRDDDVDLTEWHDEAEIKDSFHAACAWIAEHKRVAERNGYDPDEIVWNEEGSVEVDG